MKTLKLTNSAEFSSQLENKLKELESQKDAQIVEADRLRKEEAEQIKRDKNKKTDHLN